MTALNVRHVGVVTKDLNKSLKFYRDVLGFKVVKKMRETKGLMKLWLSLVFLVMKKGNLINFLEGNNKELHWLEPL